MSTKYTVRRLVLLDEALAERADKMAEARRMPFSVMVRTLLLDALREFHYDERNLNPKPKEEAGPVGRPRKSESDKQLDDMIAAQERLFLKIQEVNSGWSKIEPWFRRWRQAADARDRALLAVFEGDTIGDLAANVNLEVSFAALEEDLSRRIAEAKNSPKGES